MQKNPELNVGDRVLLVHMEGETLYDLEGEVIRIENVPKFDKNSSGIQYNVKWFDEDGKVVSNLSLIPETDRWLKI
jgi:hypothetical protein